MVAAQQARVSGQLGALAEGVGVLIKEIRELKTANQIQNAGGGGGGGGAAGGGGAGGGGGAAGGGGGGGNLQGLLAAATVGKALNAIHNAQSALNLGAGNVMGQSIAGGAAPAIAAGFRAGGGAGFGGFGLGGSLGFGGMGAGLGAAIPLPAPPPPVVSFAGLGGLGGAGGAAMAAAGGGGGGGLAGGPMADSLSTSLNALGPKAASNFLSNLAKGMNKVTSSYLAALKKQQKENESKGDGGGDGGGGGGGGGKGGKGKKGKGKASKRGIVILPAAESSFVENGGIKSPIERRFKLTDQINREEVLNALLGSKRNKLKKAVGKKTKVKKKTAAEKRKIKAKEKGDQNDALLAQKAASVTFGNGLKPSKFL